MAPLAAPHWEALPVGLRDLLAALGQIDLLRLFYLAGGTALALRLGHRISVDLGLFANLDTLDDRLRAGIVEELRKRYPVELLQDSVLGLVLTADGQAASFFSYGYPLLDPTDVVSGIQVAGLRDIALMKLDAIAGQKYPYSPSFGMRVLTALVDFDIADQQDEPLLLRAIEWEQVKAFFAAEARRLGQNWFG